jgi:hypothetical protein
VTSALANALSLDFDLTLGQVAKGCLDIPQVFKHYLGFGRALVEFFSEVSARGVQELDVVQFVQV